MALCVERGSSEVECQTLNRGSLTLNPVFTILKLGNFIFSTIFLFTQLYKWVPGYRQWWKYVSEYSSCSNCSVAEIFPVNELVTEWTGLPWGWSVKLLELSNWLDTVLYNNMHLPFISKRHISWYVYVGVCRIIGGCFLGDFRGSWTHPALLRPCWFKIQDGGPPLEQSLAEKGIWWRCRTFKVANWSQFHSTLSVHFTDTLFASCRM